MDKREYEFSQIINAKKIADSMVFKTGLSIIQLFIVLFISVMFAQVSVGFDNVNAILTGAYWANALILFSEQYYIYYIFYDWFYTALSKSDERLVGNDKEDKLGLIKECETYLNAFETNDDKLEQGLEQWNIEQKIKTWQDNVKEHITKLTNKREKALLKNKSNKAKLLKERIEEAKKLYNEKETIDNIAFINVRNYRPLNYKDLVGDGLYTEVSSGHNSPIDMKAIRKKRFLNKGLFRLLSSLMLGLLVFNAIIGGSGFWQRISVMLFAMSIQIIMAIRDAYVDNNLNIINHSLRKRALIYCANFKPKKPEEDVEKNDTNDNVAIVNSDGKLQQAN